MAFSVKVLRISSVSLTVFPCMRGCCGIENNIEGPRICLNSAQRRISELSLIDVGLTQPVLTSCGCVIGGFMPPSIYGSLLPARAALSTLHHPFYPQIKNSNFISCLGHAKNKTMHANLEIPPSHSDQCRTDKMLCLKFWLWETLASEKPAF